MFKVPEKYRIREGNLASDSSFGCNGAFMIPLNLERIFAFCIASDGEGFEHVSVSLHTRKAPIQRTPTWEEMCVIKSIFWDSEDCVMQLHPPKSEYVNNYKTCLHLWRPIGVEIPRPKMDLVGIKT